MINIIIFLVLCGSVYGDSMQNIMCIYEILRKGSTDTNNTVCVDNYDVCYDVDIKLLSLSTRLYNNGTIDMGEYDAILADFDETSYIDMGEIARDMARMQKNADFVNNYIPSHFVPNAFRLIEGVNRWTFLHDLLLYPWW